MKLIIFPGGGSPAHPLYDAVYQTVAQAAHRYGFSSVDWSLRWPGQFDRYPDNEPARTLRNAVATALNTIERLESR